MKKRLQYIDGNADKFWQIEVSGLQCTVTFGRNGTSGTSQTKSFPTESECLKFAEKILAEKIKKGYSENGQVVANTSIGQNRAVKTSNLQEVISDYDDILKYRKLIDLLPFLQEIAKGNKEGLKKHIQKSRRYWMTWTELSKEPEFRKDPKQTWGQRGDSTQQRIITLSAIALFDASEINSWDDAFQILSQKPDRTTLEFLQWAQPQWMDVFLLDKIKKRQWLNIDYDLLRFLEEQQILHYNPELFALSLGNINAYRYEQDHKKSPRAFIQGICADARAWQRDIPELFNVETGLHNAHFQDNPKEAYNAYALFSIIFQQLIEEKKLDRQQFIGHCLQIQTKEWNNNLKSFFRKQLEVIHTTPEELLQHQECIFSFFHAPYPPVVGLGTEIIREISNLPEFNIASFLEWVAPLMMRADCKGSIKSLLTVLDKIQKTAPQWAGEISHLIADVFVISDLNLQERASKSLLQYAKSDDAGLREKLQSYAPLMQGDVKNKLQAFMDQSAIPVDEVSESYQYRPQKAELLTEPVALPQNWNEILFQIGHFIASDEPLDSELILNTFITQRDLFPEDFSQQLQPYFNQLKQTYFEVFPKNHIKSFLMAKMLHVDNYKVDYLDGTHLTRLSKLGILKHSIELTQRKMARNSRLPLLSFPSHKPYWVAPKILIERILAYQESDEPIELFDLSIAICRMPREQEKDALALLPQVNPPELRRMLEYCLGIHNTIEAERNTVFSKIMGFVSGNTQPSSYTLLWALAARTFYPEEKFPEFENTHLGHLPFVASPYRPAIFFKEAWNSWKNYQTKQIERSFREIEMIVELPQAQEIPANMLYSSDMRESANMWYYTLNNEGNTLFFHSIVPQNPEALGYLLACTACKTANSSAGELKGFLWIVNQPEFWFSDVNFLVFACCFFKEKKDIRLMASEILIDLIEKQKVDLHRLGEKFGLLIFERYGALSRFVDALATIKDVSALHNAALFSLLDSTFSHLYVQYEYLTTKEKLPVNFRKLAEHYLDLLSRTRQNPSEAAQGFFEQWKDNASIKDIYKAIQKDKKAGTP